jgi:hypothetical protein
LLRLHAVDVCHRVVSDDADLALLADPVGHRAQDRVPPDGAEGRPDGFGREGDQRAPDDVAFRAKGLLDEAAVLKVADESMRGGKRQGEGRGDLGRRQCLPLLGHEGQDGQGPIQWRVARSVKFIGHVGFLVRLTLGCALLARTCKGYRPAGVLIET